MTAFSRGDSRKIYGVRSVTVGAETFRLAVGCFLFSPPRATMYLCDTGSYMGAPGVSVGVCQHASFIDSLFANRSPIGVWVGRSRRAVLQWKESWVHLLVNPAFLALPRV